MKVLLRFKSLQFLLSSISTVCVSIFLTISRIYSFFSALQTRFDEINQKASLSEILHLVTIAQEVWLPSSLRLCSKVNMRQSFLLLVVETMRFKNPVLVRTNKLGAVS